MNHVLLLPLKSNEENDESVLLPLAEMITCDQTSLNLEVFLTRVVAAIKRQTSVSNNIADYIITDCSFAEMNAIAKINRLTLEEYIETFFIVSSFDINVGFF